MVAVLLAVLCTGDCTAAAITAAAGTMVSSTSNVDAFYAVLSSDVLP
jgi:hypothetical protein